MNQLFDTLNAALDLLGCDVSQFQFDTHSAVVMQFADIGELIMEPDEGQVALWVRLETSPQLRFGQRAEELLTKLSEPADYFGSGCMALRQLDEMCAVGGVLHHTCMYEPRRMAEAIQQFHASVGELQVLMQ